MNARYEDMVAMPPDSASQDARTIAVVVATRMDAHETICTERYGRIATDTMEIKAGLAALSSDLKGAIQRIHERIDHEAETARDTVAVVAKESIHGVAGLKIWVLTSAGTILLAVIGWFADHFFGAKP